MLSAAFSMAPVESGILGPLQGWLTDRFGPQALIRAGVVVFAVGLMLLSRIDSPVTFFLTCFMIAVGTSLATVQGPAVARTILAHLGLALSPEPPGPTPRPPRSPSPTALIGSPSRSPRRDPTLPP